MILRVIHSAVPTENRMSFVDFANNTLAPAIRKMTGCEFVYIGECIEKAHEHEVIFISGWDSEEHVEAFENAPGYSDLARTGKSLYTHRYHEGAPHVHYKAIVALE